MIGIVDYGAGNLRSVKKAIEFLQVENVIITDPAAFQDVDRLILPGVGAFKASIDTLQAQGLYAPVLAWLLANRPFLGICLGLEMLFEESAEFGSSPGFGVLKGRVPQFTSGKIPQIGWNQVKQTQATPLWQGIADDAFFYFLHGFYVAPDEPAVTIGQTDYGITYTSAIRRGNLYAVQFHPEKSGAVGLQLLQNWVTLC